MEKSESDLDPSQFLNIMIDDHLDVFIDINNKNTIQGTRLLELLVHYNKNDTVFRYLVRCVRMIMVGSSLTLRSDSTATKILVKFVEICLDDLFDKYYTGKNLIGDIFVICSNAPNALRYVCYTIYSMYNNLNLQSDIAGYRAICTLIIFRYYLAKVISKKPTKDVIEECKKIQEIANFNKEEGDITMMSLVKILISFDIGGSISFNLNDNIVDEYLLDIITLIKTIPELLKEKFIMISNMELKIDETRQQNRITNPKIRLSTGTISTSPTSTPANSPEQTPRTTPRITPRTVMRSISEKLLRVRSREDTIMERPPIQTEERISYIDKSGSQDIFSKNIAKRLLHDIGINMYDSLMNQNNITCSILLHLTEADIIKLGITNAEHIMKIKKLVRKYNQIDINKALNETRLSQSAPHIQLSL